MERSIPHHDPGPSPGSDHRVHLALRERVKELTCLYGIARLGAAPDLTIESALQQAVELLPPGWLHVDVACACIVFGGRRFATDRYRDGLEQLSADITVNGRKAGWVAVAYTTPCEPADAGPFLREELDLIEAVATEIALIIEQKQSITERRQFQQKLLQADRLATIGQLAAGVAHELNEPLASVLGFAQLVQKDTGLSRQSQEDLKKIVGASMHAREVIQKLLVFARDSNLSPGPIHVNEVIEDGLSFFASRCRKAGIDIVQDLAADLPYIRADRSQILQVLINVVVNAIQAMPDGGSLTISTALSDSRVTVSVADTGIGMDERTVQKVFDPFFTTKDIDQGTGLGLSLVHGIVSSLGGSITVRSQPGAGTRFDIHLLADEESPGVPHDG